MPGDRQGTPEILINEPTPVKSAAEKYVANKDLQRLMNIFKILPDTKSQMAAEGLDPDGENAEVVDGLGLVKKTAWDRAERQLNMADAAKEATQVAVEAEKMIAAGLDPYNNKRFVDGLGMVPDTAISRVASQKKLQEVIDIFNTK